MTPPNQEKHPDAIAWDEWLNSEEGKNATEGQTTGVYLENRLFKAFMAGKKDTRHQAVLEFVERVKKQIPSELWSLSVIEAEAKQFE